MTRRLLVVWLFGWAWLACAADAGSFKLIRQGGTDPMTTSSSGSGAMRGTGAALTTDANSEYKSTSWSTERSEAAIFFANLARERMSVSSANNGALVKS